MRDVVEKLLSLQELDGKILRIKAELIEGPRRLEEDDGELSGHQKRYEELSHQSKEAMRAGERKNFDLEGIDILVCGSAKWTLAPQGGSFIYVLPDLIEQLHPDRVGRLSVTQNADLKNLTALTDYRFELAKDARRFETVSSSPLTNTL